MSECRNIEGALAAALYEPLDPAEQQRLDAHLASCPACSAEFQALQAMVAALPVETAAYEGDLLPSVRAALREAGSTSRWRWTWSLLGSGLVVVCVCFGAFVYVNAMPPTEDTPVAQVETQADRVIAQAAERVAADDAAGALAVLELARDHAETSTDAGRLQLEVANLKYDVLHRYSESYEEYKQVREGNGNVWSQSAPWVKDRWELLTESREQGFEALYQIDRARSQGEAGIPDLEQVMARYPGGFLSRESMNTMVAMVGGEGVEALEKVKNRCSNPMAVAQLDVHLGERYCTDRVNPTLGRELLTGVAGSAYEVPAKMAKDVLARLERPAE